MWGLPRHARAAGFVWRRLRAALPQQEHLPWDEETPSVVWARDRPACPEPGAASVRGAAWETDWFPVPASPPATLSGGRRGWAVRGGSSQRTRRDGRREPRPGLIHTSRSPCVREPRPRHPPGSGLPLQLTDFQMKAEISCALDLEVVSWTRPSSSSAGPWRGQRCSFGGQGGQVPAPAGGEEPPSQARLGGQHARAGSP